AAALRTRGRRGNGARGRRRVGRRPRRRRRGRRGRKGRARVRAGGQLDRRDDAPDGDLLLVIADRADEELRVLAGVRADDFVAALDRFVEKRGALPDLSVGDRLDRVASGFVHLDGEGERREADLLLRRGHTLAEVAGGIDRDFGLAG